MAKEQFLADFFQTKVAMAQTQDTLTPEELELASRVHLVEKMAADRGIDLSKHTIAEVVKVASELQIPAEPQLDKEAEEQVAALIFAGEVMANATWSRLQKLASPESNMAEELEEGYRVVDPGEQAMCEGKGLKGQAARVGENIGQKASAAKGSISSNARKALEYAKNNKGRVAGGALAAAALTAGGALGASHLLGKNKAESEPERAEQVKEAAFTLLKQSNLVGADGTIVGPSTELTPEQEAFYFLKQQGY